MIALQLECVNEAWWGGQWVGDWPYAIDASEVPTGNLPNAPVTIYVLTPDVAAAVRLIRLAADMLERTPALLARNGTDFEIVENSKTGAAS